MQSRPRLCQLVCQPCRRSVGEGVPRMLEIAVLRPRREARRCSGRAGTSESYEQARGAAVPGLREERQGGGARDGDQGERRDACHGEAGRAGGSRVVPASCVAPGRRRRRGLARERSAASTNERGGRWLRLKSTHPRFSGYLSALRAAAPLRPCHPVAQVTRKAKEARSLTPKDLPPAREAENRALPSSRTCLALSLLQLPLGAAPRCSASSQPTPSPTSRK